MSGPRAGILRVLSVAGLGLLVGIGFVLPMLAYARGGSGERRVLLLLAAAGLGILLVRRSGRLLRTLLDRAEQPSRLPLLGLYGVLAMVLPVALLLRLK